MASTAIPIPPRRQRSRGFLLALPAVLWLGLFFILPLLFVLLLSFLTRGPGSMGVLPLTTANYERVANLFMCPRGNCVDGIIARSVWIAFLTTMICLVVAYPMAFFISTRRSNAIRQFTLFLIILPFWTNFLVRTYALQTILGREGTLNSILMSLGLIQEPLALLYTEGAVLLGLVYGFLPFMVLPIYASTERFDFRFVEAAHDLGANDWKAFWRVVLPLTLPGVVAGFILVFIPTIGAFVTPNLLGGSTGFMIGNSITDQFKGTGNQPLGAALSIVLMGLVMIALLAYVRFGEQRN